MADQDPKSDSCWAKARNQFRMKMFGFSYPRSSVFYKSQWPMPQYVYIIYRTIAAGYAVGLYVLATSQYKPYYVPWYYMLTYWNYTVFAIHMLYSFCVVVFVTLRHPHAITGDMPPLIPPAKSTGGVDDNQAENLPVTTYMKVNWFFFNLASNIVYIPLLVFWPAVLTKYQEKLPTNTRELVISIHTHGVNTLSIIIDMLVSGYPIRVQHFVYVFLYGWIYIAFSVILWLVDDETIIYRDVLDWNQPNTVFASIFIQMALVVVVQLFNFGLFKMRTKIYDDCVKKTE